MNDLLFDTPLWILIALGAVSAVLLVTGNSRQNRRLMLAGLVVLLAGAGLLAASYLVQTDKEKCLSRTRQLVDAVVARDQGALMSLLHPSCALEQWRRDDIVSGAKVYADRYGLTGATITGTTVEGTPAMISTRMVVFSSHQIQSLPMDKLRSEWQLDWLESREGWLCKNITPLKIGNLDRSQVGRDYFSQRP